MYQILNVKMGTSGASFNAQVRLDTGAGVATWFGSDEPGSVHWYRTIRRDVELAPLDEDQLVILREFAERMRADGDYQYREQFAQAGITFTLDGEPPVTWDYQLDGGVPLEASDAYDVVSDQVFEALRGQRAAEKARGPLLPAVSNDQELMKLYRDTEPWLAAAQDVAKKQQLGGDTWVRASDGSQIVMLGEDAIIKFYVPFWPSIVDIEQEALDLLRHKIDSFEVPKIRGRGTVDGWEYLAMTRVQGTPLREVELADDEALSIATSVGEAIRTLHEVEVPRDSLLHDVVPKWRPFLTEQRNRRRELELKRGTSEEWADRVVDYLRSWRYRKRPTNVFLHADLTHDHIMLKKVDGRWAFAGFIDFGDAKIGDPAYEFAAPFTFWTGHRPDLRRAMLDGYGGGEELLDRIFESFLLHEFGRLGVLDLEGLDSIADVRQRFIDL